MSSFGCRPATARAVSLGYHVSLSPRPFPNNAVAGENRSCVPREREPRAICDVHDTGDDYWAGGIDLLILRVADCLRRAGVDTAETQLRRVAEEVVLDAVQFVLDWVEASGPDGSEPAVEILGAPPPVVAPAVAAGSQDASP